MATVDSRTAGLMLFSLFWVWQRRKQRRIDATAKAKASRRRIKSFSSLSRERSGPCAVRLSTHLSDATRQRRMLWMKPRSQFFFSNIVINWEDDEWRRNFRIGKPTFRFLFTQLCSSLQRRDVVRRPLSVEERITITLWRLGTNIEYISIAHLFGVGLSTVCVVVYEVCASIVNTLLQDTSGFLQVKMLKLLWIVFWRPRLPFVALVN